jgi:hypothetical protein
VVPHYFDDQDKLSVVNNERTSGGEREREVKECASVVHVVQIQLYTRVVHNSVARSTGNPHNFIYLFSVSTRCGTGTTHVT